MYYIELERAQNIHRETIRVSGGGEEGIINIGSLDSVLEFIQNDDYYPTFETKLIHLIYSVNKNHSFLDGNKRLSITLGTEFLLINGYLRCMGKFLSEMENVSYHLAAGKISYELLSKIIHSLLYENNYSESLKIEIYNAISELESEQNIQ